MLLIDLLICTERARLDRRQRMEDAKVAPQQQQQMRMEAPNDNNQGNDFDNDMGDYDFNEPYPDENNENFDNNPANIPIFTFQHEFEIDENVQFRELNEVKLHTVEGFDFLINNLSQQIANIRRPAPVNLSVLRMLRGKYVPPTYDNLRREINLFSREELDREDRYYEFLIGRIINELSTARNYLTSLENFFTSDVLNTVKYNNEDDDDSEKIANLVVYGGKPLLEHIQTKFRRIIQDWVVGAIPESRLLVSRKIPRYIFQRVGAGTAPILSRVDRFLRSVSYLSHYVFNDFFRKEQLIQFMSNPTQNVREELARPDGSWDGINRYYGGNVDMLHSYMPIRQTNIQCFKHLSTIRFTLGSRNPILKFKKIIQDLDFSNLFTTTRELYDVDRDIIVKFKIWAKNSQDQSWRSYKFLRDELNLKVFQSTRVNDRRFKNFLQQFTAQFGNIDTDEQSDALQLKEGASDDYPKNLGELREQSETIRYEVWIQSLNKVQGGCMFKHNHQTIVQDEDSNIQLHIESLVSRSNNCGIQIFIRFYKELVRNLQLNMEDVPYKYQLYVKKQAKTVKKLLFPHEPPEKEIDLEDMKILVDYFECDVTIYNNEFHRILTTQQGFHLRLLVYLDKKHYWFVRNMKCRTPNTCEHCFMTYTSNHVCDMRQNISMLVDERNEIKEKYIKMDVEEEEYEEEDDEEEDVDVYDEEEDKIPDECQDIMKSLLEKQRNVLIHGPGGTGKTTTIRYITKQLRKLHMKVCVTALTGIAATHINGVTLQSAIRVGINLFKPVKEIVDKQKKDKKYYTFIKNLQVLIIDEISMMNDILFRRLHLFLSQMRSNNLLFGGVQLVLSGDVLQLPPINSIGYPAFFFRSPVFEELLSCIDIFHFHRIYRQLDTKFQDTLNAVRIGKVRKEHILLLQSRLTMVENEDLLHIFPKRNMVLAHNKKMISKLEENKEKYEFVSEDSEGSKSLMNRHSLISEKLILVEGARVMIVRNLKIGSVKVYNGQQGVFLAFIKKNNTLKVKMDSGRIIYLEKMKFSIPLMNADLESTPYRIQYPIILAYAITIHKSQGMTLHNAVIDVGSNIFESSQVYVALSRISSTDGLILKSFNPDKIQVKRDAMNFNDFVEKHNVYTDISEKKIFIQNISRDLNVSISNDKWVHHELRKKQFDILEKTVFFDFETYVDKQDDILSPYYNHLIYYENGVVRKKETFQLGRNTEDVCKSSFDWLFNILEQDALQYRSKYKRGTVAGQWSRYKPIYLCAFNGSNFDFHWLMKYLIQNKKYGERYSSHQVLKGSSIVSLQLYDEEHGRLILKTHDICNILTTSLDVAVKSFCGETLKGVFPHKYMNKVQGRLDGNNRYVQLCMDDFFEAHHSKVNDMIKNGDLDLDQYNIQYELDKYGKSDVDIMVKLYKVVDELCRNILRTNIFTFNTASAMTRWGLMINLPKNAVMVKNKKLIISKLNSWKMEDEVKIRKAVYAGKTLPRIIQYTSSSERDTYEDLEKDHYVYLDASGFYASVMLNEKYPIGPYKYLNVNNMSDRMDLHFLQTFFKDKETMNKMKNDLPMFIAYCHVIPNVYDIEPCIGRRDDNGKLHWDNIPRWGWYSSVSIQLVIAAGGKLESISECFYWSESCYIFKKWMNFTIGLKASKEEGRKKLGKLLGNGTYGINLQRIHNDIIKIVKNKQQLNDFHTKYKWTDVFPSGGNLIMKGVPQLPEDQPSPHPIHLGVFILDYTKKIIHEITEKANPYRYSGSWKSVLNQPLYGDTDSLVFHCSQLPFVHNLIGKENGQWGDEIYDNWEKMGLGKYKFARIHKWVGAQPKLYSLVARLPTDKVYTKLKCKGIPQHNISYMFEGEKHEKMNYDVLSKVVEKDDKLEVHMNDRLKRVAYRLSKLDQMKDTGAFSIRSQHMSRTLFQTKWSGRRILTEEEHVEVLKGKNEYLCGNYSGFTVPHGWQLRE